MKRAILLVGVSSLVLSLPALAEDVGKTFSLGTVATTANAPSEAEQGGGMITREDMQMFDRNTLDEAVRLVPGVTTSVTGGRNDVSLRIRGYGGDRGTSGQIPIYLDGIQIYLPYDNGLDISRFTTSDLAEIQISKSYSSVIAGPGAIGGAVNMVSRQVTKPFEGDYRITSSFDQNGAFNGIVTDTFLGSKVGNWYIQGSGSENYQNHFRLSDDYKAGPYENGGNRDHSKHEDRKFNIKVGVTPNATDEYSLNVVDQEGSKNSLLPDASAMPKNETCAIGGTNKLKCWGWPDWDNRSAYWLSKTEFDDKGSYIKTRGYYEQFYNTVDYWDNTAYTDKSSTSASGTSIYDERSAGGSIELSKILMDGADNLKSAFHYRWDNFNSIGQYPVTTGGQLYKTPWSRDEENTYSIAIENTYHPAKNWDLTPGISYDYQQLISAYDWNTTSKKFVFYPVSDHHAVNPQALVTYHYNESGAVHGSVSQRTRFPTMFEMFSTKLGTADSNPYLGPEKAVSWETGVSDTVNHVHVVANVFYSTLYNAIEYVKLADGNNQDQNVGTEIHKGFDLEASAPVLSTLDLGASYSFLIRKLSNPAEVTAASSSNSVILTGTPRHHAMLYGDWHPIENFYVIPSVELNGKEWFSGSTSTGSTTYYYKSGDYAVVNLKLGYNITNDFTVEAGVKNLLDVNYAIDDGYHAEGRNLFATARIKF